ncbi:calcium-binding EF-hand family protein [Tanacetum coccineum]
MGVILIDGATVRSFVNDDVHFKTSVDEQFVSLDTNKDGVLSKSEMRKAFETMRFDEDKNGTIDINEFRSEIKKIMLAIAGWLGTPPIPDGG